MCEAQKKDCVRDLDVSSLLKMEENAIGLLSRRKYRTGRAENRC